MIPCCVASLMYVEYVWRVRMDWSTLRSINKKIGQIRDALSMKNQWKFHILQFQTGLGKIPSLWMSQGAHLTCQDTKEA